MVSSSKIEIRWNCFEEELEESSGVTRQGLLINRVGVEKSNVIVFSAAQGGGGGGTPHMKGVGMLVANFELNP